MWWVVLYWLLVLGVEANPYETQLVAWTVEARPDDAARFGCALAAAPPVAELDKWRDALQAYQRHREPGAVSAYRWRQHCLEQGIKTEEPRQSDCDYWTRQLCRYAPLPPPNPPTEDPPVSVVNTTFVAPVQCRMISETGEQCVGGNRIASEPFSLLPCRGHFRLCRTRTQLTRQAVVRCTCSHEFRILYGN